jgi:hypothetical protein
MTKKSKTDKVWAYLVEHPLASTSEVAKATGTSYSYTYKLKSKIGTPKEVFEMEAMRQRLEEGRRRTTPPCSTVARSRGDYVRRS